MEFLEVADTLEVKGLCHIRSNSSVRNLLEPGPRRDSPSPPPDSVTRLPLSYSSAQSTSPSELPPSPAGGHIDAGGGHQLFSDQDDQEDEEIDLEMSTTSQCRLDLEPCRFSEARDNLSVGECSAGLDAEADVRNDHQNRGLSNFEVEDQISGIDLSLAKPEPWSPREGSRNDHNSSNKRKKIVSF